jgi:hypothetical protein
MQPIEAGLEAQLGEHQLRSDVEQGRGARWDI